MENKKKTTKKVTKSEHQEAVQKQKVVLMTLVVCLLCMAFVAMGYAIGTVGTAGEMANSIQDAN